MELTNTDTYPQVIQRRLPKYSLRLLCIFNSSDTTTWSKNISFRGKRANIKGI